MDDMLQVHDANQPVIFGIRHLSPAGAWHLRELLDKLMPELVLIEGPSDFSEEIVCLPDKNTKPPIAIMAYTSEPPVRTILYPFARYSPEYQAVLWAHENRRECRFIDLPSGIFLALSGCEDRDENTGEEKWAVYDKLSGLSGDDSHETFWERTLEHSSDAAGYWKGAEVFGRNLRGLTARKDSSYAETVVREAYMKRQIKEAVDSGIQPEKIVVVTGAYHVEGLESSTPPLSDEELKGLPYVETQKTLMPYSYYRLSSRSGYGAGNKAPAYYDLLWEGFQRGEASYAARSYLSRLAAWQRKNGNMVSSAEVIEAVRLSFSLAGLRGYNLPALRDLRDAAVTCIGHGRLGEIAMAVADTEIGTTIGFLPQGTSRTSIQNDFYRQLDELNLKRYFSVTADDLRLDLREKLGVKSQKAAFMDLERSFFLHRLRVLGISFVSFSPGQQERATWAENWVLRWTPEAEIEIVEAQLKGDTVLLAAAFQMKEEAENGGSIASVAKIIEQSFLCGMPETAAYATSVLQKIAVDAASVEEIAETARQLSLVIQYGSIRKISSEPLVPILKQLFLRACLLLPGCCICDDNASHGLVQSIGILNETAVCHEFLPAERWVNVMKEIADRDDLNTKVSGYAAAVLLERGELSNEELELKVERRLSKGVPADMGAGWFEGFSMKNRYALIIRTSLWESLDKYLDTLDDEEFKRALLFLRRAFADFTSADKDAIAENLGEIWHLDTQETSVEEGLSQESQVMLDELDEFDFGDI